MQVQTVYGAVEIVKWPDLEIPMTGAYWVTYYTKQTEMGLRLFQRRKLDTEIVAGRMLANVRR